MLHACIVYVSSYSYIFYIYIYIHTCSYIFIYQNSWTVLPRIKEAGREQERKREKGEGWERMKLSEIKERRNQKIETTCWFDNVVLCKGKKDGASAEVLGTSEARSKLASGRLLFHLQELFGGIISLLFAFFLLQK